MDKSSKLVRLNSRGYQLLVALFRLLNESILPKCFLLNPIAYTTTRETKFDNEVHSTYRRNRRIFNKKRINKKGLLIEAFVESDTILDED